MYYKGQWSQVQFLIYEKGGKGCGSKKSLTEVVQVCDVAFGLVRKNCCLLHNSFFINWGMSSETKSEKIKTLTSGTV